MLRGHARARQERLREQARRLQLPLAALCACVGVSGAFTALNRGVASSGPRQSVLAAAFCVVACGMYLAYMLTRALVYLVVDYVEGHHAPYAALEEEDGGCDEEDLLLADEEEEEGGDARRRGAALPFAQLMRVVAAEGGARRQKAIAAVHRDAVISSMYLGGCGAFAALLPLCMWDAAVSAAFVGSLGLVALLLEAEPKVPEFRPNVDRAAAVRNLRLLRGAATAAVLSTVAMVLLLDVTGTRADLLRAAANASDPEAALDLEAAGLLPWPLLLLAAASPFALRAAATPLRSGTRAQRLTAVLVTPSQALEAGLPVSTLLAILVLCWYSPVDEIVVHDELLTRHGVPMVLLCPPCIAAALLLVLRGLRHGETLATSAVLACALAARQQATDRRLRDRVDAVALAGAAQAAMALATLLLYRARVAAPPRGGAALAPASDAEAYAADAAAAEEGEADSAKDGASLTGARAICVSPRGQRE